MVNIDILKQTWVDLQEFCYSLCKNIRSHFSLDILSYMHDIAIPTKALGSKFHDVHIKKIQEPNLGTEASFPNLESNTMSSVIG